MKKHDTPKPGQLAVEALLPHYSGRVGKLAKDLGVHRNTVSNWRKGKVDTPKSQVQNMNRLLKIKTF